MITVFKIIVIFIILRYVLKLLSPFILRYFLKRVERKIKNNFNNFHKDNIPDKKEKNKQESNDGTGEYIDFEEID